MSIHVLFSFSIDVGVRGGGWFIGEGKSSGNIICTICDVHMF